MARLRDIVTLKNIPVDQVKPENVASDEFLASSLMLEEQKIPISVRPIVNGKYQYEIIDGRRRFSNMVDQGQEFVLAEVWTDVDDEELHKRALIANSGKPNPIDEAYHMLSLKEAGYTGDQIATITGYSPGRISITMKIAEKLHPGLKDRAKQGKMGISACVAATKLPLNIQEELLNENDNIISHKVVAEKVRKWQGEQINLLEDEDRTEQVRGLYLSAKQIDLMLDGELVGVDWNGNKFSLGIVGEIENV